MLESGESYSAESILAMTVQEVARYTYLDRINIVFSDKAMVLSGKELHLSRILWRLYKEFPVFVMESKHSYAHHRRRFSANTMNDILNDILWDNYELAVDQGYRPDMIHLTKVLYDIADETYEVYRDLPSKVVSISVMDFIEIHDSKLVSERTTAIWDKPIDQVNEKDIGSIYEAVSSVTTSEKTLAAVPTAMAARCSAIKIGQLYKCCAPYGFITDVDDYRFRYPVLNSLVSGLKRIEDTVRESRTAAMSVYLQQSAMRKSEYTTRRIQGGVAIISRVHRWVDCGTKRYSPFQMPDNHLRDMVGIPYLDDDGVERRIKEKDRHLLGRFVNLRTIFGCEIGDRFGFCEHCYGDLAKSIMPDDNIGYIAATCLQELITQSILSAKHLIASAAIATFTFQGEDKNYLVNQPNNSGFWVNPNLKQRGRVEICFNEKDASKLQDIDFIPDINIVTPSRLTRLSSVRFRVYRDDVMVNDYPVVTSTESRGAFFTIEALQYFKDKKWRIDSTGNYIVDLSDWDYDNPIMDMPMIQYSTPAHMAAVSQAMISGGDEDDMSIPTFTSPLAATASLFELVRSKVEVNFIHIQVIVSAYLAEDPHNLDFRVPKYKYKGELVKYNSIMLNRDSGLAMSYQGRNKGFFAKPEAYIIENRHPHPMNKLLT